MSRGSSNASTTASIKCAAPGFTLRKAMGTPINSAIFRKGAPPSTSRLASVTKLILAPLEPNPNMDSPKSGEDIGRLVPHDDLVRSRNRSCIYRGTETVAPRRAH